MRHNRGRDEFGFSSLEQQMAVVGRIATEFDTEKRQAGYDAISRTMSGISGGGGGFAIKPDFADSVWDQARTVDGPFARCLWASCQAREFDWPIFQTASRSNSSRWGGMLASWGLTETADLSTVGSGPATGNVKFVMQPCAVYTSPISRNLLADSLLVKPMLDYAARSEIRYALEYAMINGGATGLSTAGPKVIASPQGAIGAASTVVVSKGSTSGGAISAANIDLVWSSIAGGNKRNSVWHCSDETLYAIDQLAVSGQWPENTYISAGKYGNEYSLIKGRPVLCSEACPTIGTQGDLLCVDWTDYALVLHRPKPTDSGLAFTLSQPKDTGHLGVVGMPEDAIEARMSDEFLWGNDEVCFLWRFRVDGRFLWLGTQTNPNGLVVGPAACIATR